MITILMVMIMIYHDDHGHHCCYKNLDNDEAKEPLDIWVAQGSVSCQPLVWVELEQRLHLKIIIITIIVIDDYDDDDSHHVGSFRGGRLKEVLEWSTSH